jgi:hypothetical protein
MTNKNKKEQSTDYTKKETSFNIVYIISNVTIPEIDNSDLLNFGMAFMKIREREINKTETT